MGEIRFVGTGETRGYLYPVCKKKVIPWLVHLNGRKSTDYLLVQADISWYNYQFDKKVICIRNP